MGYKHVAINEDYHTKLEKLGDTLHFKNKGALVESMIIYFETLGVDPRELDGTTFNKEFTKLKKDIANLRETTVSFIRQQEKGMLKPLFDQVNVNTQQLLNYLSQEPLTVKHLEEFKILLGSAGHRAKQLKSADVSENESIKQQNELSKDKDFEAQVENIKVKAEMVISHAKDLFKKFIETGKKTIGRGTHFEENVINFYKSEFERLKLKI